jgi:hypothetical protein
MIAQARVNSWSTLLTYCSLLTLLLTFPRLNGRRLPGFRSLCQTPLCWVSNLAQNPGSERVIVNLAEMREKRLCKKIAWPIGSSRIHPLGGLKKWVSYGTRTSTAARSLPKTASQDRQLRLEAVYGGSAAASRLCIAKDVSFLWVNHAAGTEVLSGVREVACTSDNLSEIESASSETLE